MQNQAGSDSVLADCVRFGPNGSNPEEKQYKRIIRPASGKCFPADPDRMRIGSSMFTELFVKIFASLHSILHYSQRQIGCSFSFVSAPNQLLSFGTLCSMFDAVCVPDCVSVSISWYCMFHNGCISCCVFGHFTAVPRHGIGAGRSGKNQFIRRLEKGLHFFLGNTKPLTTQVNMFVEKLNH